MSRFLITGGTGFVGGHAIARLLDEGHDVRTTVRDVARGDDVRRIAADGGRDTSRLEIVAADLTNDSGWRVAVDGCDYVWHVASPFPTAQPKDVDALVGPARDGALRVLRAARDGGVRRVVMTSSFAAIGYGHAPRAAPFTEDDWSNPDGQDVQPYMRSKVLAERAAWEMIDREGGSLELAVVNPVGIFGPALGPDLSGSLRIIQAMLTGAMPACPRVFFGVVDVRDVVDLHLRATTSPHANGQRFLAVAGDTIAMLDVARILRDGLGDAAARTPTRQLPDLLVRLLSLVKAPLREVVPQLGRVRRASNAKAREALGWTPRTNEEAIVAAGESLVRLHLV